MFDLPSPLQLIVASPRWVIDITNDVLYTIVDQLLLLVEETVDTERSIRKLLLAAPPPPPAGSILSLVHRYSRTRDAGVVYYGFGKAEITQSLLYGHYERLRTARLNEVHTINLLWDMSTSSWISSSSGSTVSSDTRVFENQLARILEAWGKLVKTIKEGKYYTPEQLANPRPCDGYCTNILDVHLLYELDKLTQLELNRSGFEPERDTILLARHRAERRLSRQRKCDCSVCETRMYGVRPQVVEAFKVAILQHHSDIDRVLFLNCFGHIVKQPWPPRPPRLSVTTLQNTIADRGRTMLTKMLV